ncbi:hypothetical protein OsI_26306 [Oryza sativa Indica Group]|uniref:Uncharacterized protein n=1 Tax=Oryza sativa subsp. indica TaxID=39946 RepID=B8B6X7_ORYSI|nr:hypothetical protein OsI_26306 [Oryza sativa Indica Group]
MAELDDNNGRGPQLLVVGKQELQVGPVGQWQVLGKREVVVKDELMESSLHKYVFVRDIHGEAEPQESGGSNSFAGKRVDALVGAQFRRFDRPDMDGVAVQQQRIGGVAQQRRGGGGGYKEQCPAIIVHGDGRRGGVGHRALAAGVSKMRLPALNAATHWIPSTSPLSIPQTLTITRDPPYPMLPRSHGHRTGGGGFSLKSSPFSSVGEERVPDPKPRRNPRPEQIRILEAIFNSGMNRKSRSKNKLRSGGTARAGLGLGGNRASAPPPAATAHREAVAPSFTPPPILPPQPVQPQQQLVSPVAAPTSLSSSSSDRSSGSSKPARATLTQAMSVTAAMDLLSPLRRSARPRQEQRHV